MRPELLKSQSREAYNTRQAIKVAELMAKRIKATLVEHDGETK